MKTIKISPSASWTPESEKTDRMQCFGPDPYWIRNFIFSSEFFPIFGHQKTLEPKMLDPDPYSLDPDPNQINTDPKHWCPANRTLELEKFDRRHCKKFHLSNSGCWLGRGAQRQAASTRLAMRASSSPEMFFFISRVSWKCLKTAAAWNRKLPDFQNTSASFW